MCGRFVMITKDELDDILVEIQFGNQVNPLPDWPARRPDAYPKTLVPLLVMEGEALKPAILRWGYPVSWNKNVVFNTRIETALESPANMWRDSLDSRRCVIPSLGFYEPHRTETRTSEKTGKQIKQQYLFTATPDPLTFMAGIYEDGHFSIMTTAPDTFVRPVHDRMPIVLGQGEILPWLTGASAESFAAGRPGLSANPS